MAILIQFICVLVKLDSIISKYQGGIEGFVKDVPNQTLCMDSKLARVGFMNFYDVESYISLLTKAGLVYTEQGKSVDIVVVDQLTGLTTNCDWIEFGSMGAKGSRRYTVCRLVHDDIDTLMTHNGGHGELKSNYCGKPLTMTGKFEKMEFRIHET